MWIIHPHGGFLSAVQHNDDPSLLVVRARIAADLEALAWTANADREDGPPFTITGGDLTTDYPWRVIVPRKAFAAYVADLVANVDYGNVKAKVYVNDLNGIPGWRRAEVYGRVWADLLDLERLDPNGRQNMAERQGGQK